MHRLAYPPLEASQVDYAQMNVAKGNLSGGYIAQCMDMLPTPLSQPPGEGGWDRGVSTLAGLALLIQTVGSLFV
jgi:hypothetical protein